MDNRYEKLVLEAEKGITFEVSKGASRELIIRAVLGTMAKDVYQNLPAVSAGQCAEELSVYTDKDGNQAVIPPGWTVSGISKENTIWGKGVSLVIYDIPYVRLINWENPKDVEEAKRNYSQFVWTPVAFLDSNGTLDGEQFSEKFGRRNYQEDEFSDDEFHEDLKGELLEQHESVKKYGGFYISRYDISKSSEGKPKSVKGVTPWVNIDFDTAKKVASTIENTEDVQSHLTFGAENDSVLEWLIESKEKNLHAIAEDSTEWGNHWNTMSSPKAVGETGSREEWCANNLYDFAGNVEEWTQETNGGSYNVIRGGYYDAVGDLYPVAYRNYDDPDRCYTVTGFRATLRIR